MQTTEAEALTNETDAAIDDDEIEENDPLEVSPHRPVVFISHRCVVEPDRSIALRLYEDLIGDCDVYVNSVEPAGVPFDQKIEDVLKRADFVIALITAQANESDWVKYELFRAAERHKLEHQPIIIPVRLGFDGPYSYSIGASINKWDPIIAEPDEYDQILKRIRASIINPEPEIDYVIFGIEGFLMREFRKNLTRVACLDSPALQRAGERLRREKLFWVVGDAGVRNYFARSLAVKENDREQAGREEKDRSIYEVPRSLKWSKVDDTLVRDAIIIFPDVNPSILFDEDSSRDELKSLKRLVDRNLVIATASAESYSDIEQELRNRDFESRTRVVVDHNFYNEPERLEIFERLLDFSHKAGYLTYKQHQWAQQLLVTSAERGVFQTIINKWSPGDIERFVTHLGEVKGPDDIHMLLQRNADLENEIHLWFNALDDSTRCFVLALAMLCGLRKEELWQNYKLIVQRLRQLDANLSLQPLGICRQRAASYVTTEGQLDFVDERIAEAIYRELSKNCREYLVELNELIRDLSVPAGRERKPTDVKEQRKLEADKDKELRIALARITGKAGRQGLEDFTALLNFWGADPMLAIREAVALALEQAVAERTGARHALSLLEKWCHDSSPRPDALFRTAAAASALASIVGVSHSRDVCAKALSLLEQLAGSDRPAVKFYVSIALKKIGRKTPLTADETSTGLAPLLALVAHDAKGTTKINVAETLVEARIANEAAALTLIGDWMAGRDADCRWVAMCSLFLWRKQRNEERNRFVAEFLALDPYTVANMLVETLNEKYQKAPIYWDCFKQFVAEADGTARRALVSGMSAPQQVSLDEKLLPLLRSSENPRLRGLVVELRTQRWRQMFPNAPEFVADLHKDIHHERLASEIVGTLAGLLEPEPAGSRTQLIEALVSCIPDERQVLEDILRRLTAMAPPIFEPFATEVRVAGLQKLFDDPLALVRIIAESLSDTAGSDETCIALEILAQPEPRGHHAELLQALGEAQTVSAVALQNVLRQFRATSSRTLSELAYEFNFLSLNDDLEDPERFLSRVMADLRDPFERSSVLQALRELSQATPQGRRLAVVQALGIARASRPAEVNALLLDQSWQEHSWPFSVSTEVKLFSFLVYIFSPRVASKVLAALR